MRRLNSSTIPGESWTPSQRTPSELPTPLALVRCSTAPRYTTRLVTRQTCMLTLSISASRSRSAPHTPLASMIPAFSPFSLLALPSTLLMIVSGIAPIVSDPGIISRNNHHQSLLRTTSLNLALETTSSSHRTSSPTSMPMAPPTTSTPQLRMLLRSTSLVTSLSPMPTTGGSSPSAAQRR
jgi:hypothetical protein